MLRDETLAREPKLFQVFVRSLEHRCTNIDGIFFQCHKTTFFYFRFSNVELYFDVTRFWVETLLCGKRSNIFAVTLSEKRDLDCGFGKASSSGESSDLVRSRVDSCVLAARELEKKKKNEEEYLKVTWPLFREQKRCNDADVNSTQLMSGGAALFTFTDPRWIASRLRSFLEQLMIQIMI